MDAITHPSSVPTSLSDFLSHHNPYITPSPSTSRPIPTRSHTEETIARHLVIYVFPAIICVGTLGNALSFAVLGRSRMRRTSVYLYLMALACVDTAVLYLSAFKTWLRVVVDFEFLHVSDAACRTTLFAVQLVMHMSAWLLVLVTADRFIAVWFPFRAATMCSARRARLAILTLAAVLVAYNLHLFWTTNLRKSVDRTRQPSYNTTTVTMMVNYQSVVTSQSTDSPEYDLTNDSDRGLLRNGVGEIRREAFVCTGKSGMFFMHEAYGFSSWSLTQSSLLASY